jgi:hypothetical protein
MTLDGHMNRRSEQRTSHHSARRVRKGIRRGYLSWTLTHEELAGFVGMGGRMWGGGTGNQSMLQIGNSMCEVESHKRACRCLRISEDWRPGDEPGEMT